VIEFETKVVMKPGRGVFLDHQRAFCPFTLARRAARSRSKKSALPNKPQPTRRLVLFNFGERCAL